MSSIPNQVSNDRRVIGISVGSGQPIDNDILRFSTISNQWELIQDQTGDITGALNVGLGEHIFKNELLGILNFKTITNSTDILLTGALDELQIALSVAFLARISTIESDILLRELLSNKDIANGYAGLSATSKIVNSQISEVLALDDLTDMPVPVADQFLKRNALDTAYEFAAAGGGGIDENTILEINGITKTLGIWILLGL